MEAFKLLPHETVDYCLSYDLRYQPMNLFKNLPMDLVKQCLSYDRRFVIRCGCIYQINKISRSDERYAILEKIPLIGNSKFVEFNNIYISYLDSTKLVGERDRYRFSYTIVFNKGKSAMRYYIRKIDSIEEKEISMKNYKRI